MHKLDIPEPSAEEKQHSAELQALIHREINRASGWINFAQYMQLALYSPGLGYYAAGRQKFGEQGDFITAPEISPLFAQTIANPVSQILQSMPEGNLIEFGAGSGKLAAHLLAELSRKKTLPQRYYIIELSAELKQRQQKIIKKMVPHLFERVEWLSALPVNIINAVVLANEVLDAMPVQRFIKNSNSIDCLGVATENQSLILKTQPADTVIKNDICTIEKDLGYELCNGYASEINTNIRPWLTSLAACLQQAAVYIIDYGYPRAEYYLPERSMGTFMGYHRHRAIDEPLWYPGLQDMTAFVDFSEVANAALQAGFELAGFTSQANFLLDSGLLELVNSIESMDEIEYFQTVQKLKTLTLPAEMGERFKVIGLNYNLPMELPGFGIRDFRHRL